MNTIFDIIAVVGALALCVYIALSLIRPEWF